MTRSDAHAIQNGNLLAEFVVNEIRKCSLQHKTQPRTQSSKIINRCKFCLYSHKRGSCPAYGKSYNNCKKKGHLSKCCPNFDSKVDFVKQNIDNSDSELFNNCESLFIGNVEDKEISSSENEWAVDLLINKTLLSFKIDCGAQANIIPENCFRTKKNINYINQMLN